MEKRNITINIRLTESELAMIQEKMMELGTTNMSAYIRKMAIDGYTVKLDLPELREMVRLLRSYSNNLNQIARRVNSTNSLYSTDFDEILQTQEQIWVGTEKILRSLAKI